MYELLSIIKADLRNTTETRIPKMKKKLALVLTAITLSMTLFVGCGNTETTGVADETIANTVEETVVDVVEPIEAPHEHTYTEEVTTPATCLEDGEKTFTCECGDTYTEAIPATGHDFAEYVSNEDATYEADGTETATCSVCGETDTRVAEGSMLTYTFEDMEATKYAKSTVNVRSLPTADGEKLGGLSTNDEVKVTGKCNETGWYRIEYSDSVAYVSDSYLVDNKVETKPAETSASNSGSNSSTVSNGTFPYALYTVYYDEATDSKYYYKPRKATFFDYPQAVYDECMRYNRDHHSDDGVNPHAGYVSGVFDTGYNTESGDDIIKYIAW